MNHTISSVVILIMFVSIYVFCVSTYTFIASLNNVNLWIKKKDQLGESNRLLRTKRENSGYGDILLNDPWNTNITFNICCDKGEYMNSQLECVKANTNETLDVMMLLDSVVVDDNLSYNFINMSRVFYQHGFGDLCTIEEAIVVTWSPNQSNSYHIFQKDGQIVEVSEDRNAVISKFSTSSYCLNQNPEIHSYYSALICPCRDKVCIRKCCKNGHYYNVLDNLCKQGKEDMSYKPVFYENNIVSKANISYQLINGSVNCTRTNRLIKNESHSSPLYIQTNSQLMVVLDEERIEILLDNKK
ncbi:hypothetical protein NQ317_005112 [Molorchus minor]|uniref:Methuselah N-terminal domain-containing protein n=1 Tax=Molorchus minor TaxID=1323400 RepID=A0ABQ9JVX1_9CUCU|nr:hypothetical protein NQ317_005112 [Molorchus minor]